MAKVRFIPVFNCKREPETHACAVNYDEEYTPISLFSLADDGKTHCGNFSPTSEPSEEHMQKVAFTWASKAELEGEIYAGVEIVCPETSCRWHRSVEK